MQLSRKFVGWAIGQTDKQPNSGTSECNIALTMREGYNIIDILPYIRRNGYQRKTFKNKADDATLYAPGP